MLPEAFGIFRQYLVNIPVPLEDLVTHIGRYLCHLDTIGKTKSLSV